MPDRLSTQNLHPTTPPKTGRSLTGQRLSIGPRSSSLTNSPSNSSNASLSSTGRLQKGSSLKYELNNEPAEGVEDPLDIVCRIIGAAAGQESSSKPDAGATDTDVRPTELISNIDFGGLSLEQFAGVSRTKELENASDGSTASSAVNPTLPVKDCMFAPELIFERLASL